MTADLILPLLMRWAHVGAAVVVVGGLLFNHFIFSPAAKSALTEAERNKLRGPMMKRWKMVVHTAIILFLVSGFYNYMVITAPLHKGQGLYHALFGVKFLLALAMFTLSIIMTSSKQWAVTLQAKQGLKTLLILLAIVIVAIGSLMRTLPKNTAVDDVKHAIETQIEKIQEV